MIDYPERILQEDAIFKQSTPIETIQIKPSKNIQTALTKFIWKILNYVIFIKMKPIWSVKKMWMNVNMPVPTTFETYRDKIVAQNIKTVKPSFVRFKDLNPVVGHIELWPIWILYEAESMVGPLAALAHIVLR